MKLVFWLLDINHEVVDHEPEIWLWGISEDGKRVLVIHRGFYSYFYAVPKAGKEQQVIEKIESIREKLPHIVGVEAVEKKYFGEKLKAVKVICRDPAVVDDYAKKISKIEQVRMCLEHDIRYSMKYMIDNDVSPCSWHEVEVEDVDKGPDATVDAVYLAKEAPKRVGREGTPDLRIMAFHPIYYSKRGSPKPERDPVIIIATLNSSGDSKLFFSENGDDSEVIKGFLEYVKEYDPDILVGFESNQRHLPYLNKRSSILGLKFSITRTGTEVHTSAYGHISVTGRANVDLYDFIEDIAAIKLKTLENMAEYFGVEQPRRIREYEIPSYWEDPEKRPDLKQYAAECSKSIMGISASILDFAIQLSELVGIPLDHVGTAAVGFKVEWYLIREAHKRSELVPERVERPYRPYPGAIVLEPKPGRHEKIAVLDFTSMYPSIMIAYNISPDTYVPPDAREGGEEYYFAPEVNHAFRKEPPGFYKEVLSKLLAARREIREKLKSLDPESPEYRALDARQKALKVIANASYGYSGWIGARWYIKPVAEATTAWGRATIRETISIAEENGLELIYGDTDSIFVRYEPDKIKSFLRAVEEKLRLEIKIDKIYEQVIFTEAKKRYAGLLPDGRLDIVGLEVVRGDWPDVARKVQRKVLEIMLREKDLEKAKKEAIAYVKGFISDLRQGKVPYDDLIIWKEITRPLEEYKARGAHIEAAKRMIEAGWELEPGDKVGFVILKGEGKLYQRAAPYFMASLEDIDLEYYVRNQVLPASLRILSVFGVKEEDLISEREGLMAFL